MPSISGVLTQTAADTTRTRVVQTQITDFTNFGLKIAYISFVLNPVLISGWAAAVGQYIEASITTDTSQLDFTFGYGVRQGAGPAILPITDRLIIAPSIPVIVDKTFTVKLRSAGTGVSNSVIYKIFYEKVPLTETEIALLNEIVYV
jgi:hypothetical protein